MKNKFAACLCLMTLSGAFVMSNSKPAEAAETTCTVSSVGWSKWGGGTLQVNCGGAWYYAFGTHNSCSTESIDTRKAWQSLAQAAFLSGKSVVIQSNTCTGGPAITYVALK